MESIYTSFSDLKLDLIEATIISMFVFVIGYWIGALKSKKLMRKMQKMEKEIRNLNSELLYNSGQPTLLTASRG
jgi:hypothetical protein